MIGATAGLYGRDMKFLTDDSRAGIQLTKAGPLWRMRLLLDGQDVGDFEPAIPWTGIKALTLLHEVSDPRVDPGSKTSDDLLAVLHSDDGLHDRCLGGKAESFDAWLIFNYSFGDRAVFVTVRADEAATPGRARTVTTVLGAWLELAETALRYYETAAI